MASVYELINPRSQGSSRWNPASRAPTETEKQSPAAAQPPGQVLLPRPEIAHRAPALLLPLWQGAGPQSQGEGRLPKSRTGSQALAPADTLGADAPSTSKRSLASKAKIWAALGQPGSCRHLTAELLSVHQFLLTRSGFNSTQLSERSLECEIEGVLFLKIFFSLPSPLWFSEGSKASPSQLPTEVLEPPGSISL